MKMAKHLLYIVVIGSQIVGKSIMKAIKEEINLSQEAAKYLQQQNQQIKQAKSGEVSLQEAQDILNTGKEFTKEDVEEKFKYLFDANADKKGGNRYLRSKIVRAKERLDNELNNRTKSRF